MSTVLVTGATGFLGPYLMESFGSLGRVIGVARSSTDCLCDLTDRSAVKSLLQEIKPDAVVHAAALTDVDQCEREPARAMQVNRDATANLVDHLPAATAFLYVSTDQVYPGDGAPHVEGHEGPVNVYGASKLAGEVVARRHARALVLRTNLFGISRGQKSASLVDFLVKSFRKGDPITLFTDIFFSPLHVETMARIAGECIQKNLMGTFNIGSHDGMSKSAFALAVAHHMDMPAGNAHNGTSASFPARAPRPSDMRMDVSRIEKAIDRRMPTLAYEIKKL